MQVIRTDANVKLDQSNFGLDCNANHLFICYAINYSIIIFLNMASHLIMLT